MNQSEYIAKIVADNQVILSVTKKDIRDIAEKIRNGMTHKEEYTPGVIEAAAAEWLEQFLDDIISDANWYAWSSTAISHAPDFDKFLAREEAKGKLNERSRD